MLPPRVPGRAQCYDGFMERPRLRPTFELSAELSAAQITQRLEANLARVRGSILVTFIRETIELEPDPSILHLWSPQLRLDMAESDGRTLVRGRFAPHAHVWSLYLAIHALGALGTVGAAMFGISQYLAGQSPWALWALPIAPVLAALVWAFAFVGQGLASEQMYLLRRFVEDALAEEGASAADGDHAAA